MLGNETCVEVTRDEIGMRQQRCLKWDVRADASDDKPVQCFAHFVNRVLSVPSMHNQFRNHRVVVHRNLTALLHPCVDPNTHPFAGVRLKHRGFRGLKTNQSTRGRQEVSKRVFCVDAAFDRPTISLNIGLGKGQFFTGRHPNHPFHQVQACDAFGDWVFHLQTGVHF